MRRAPQLQWRAAALPDLPSAELFEAMRLRVDIFVVEQQCAYPELDDQDLDPRTTHLMGRTDDGRLAAYCRVLPPGADGVPHIGRVLVAPEFRGLGLGRELMLHGIGIARKFNATASAVAAQEHLRRFYESLGYRAVGQPYSMDGIPHLDMVRHAPDERTVT